MENTGLGGVTVRLSGMAEEQFVTESDGQFTFTGLRAGTYSVEISGFDMDEVGFGSVAKGATIGVGESRILTFDGTYLRTAGIMGQVSIDGVGLGGVTVTMTGEGEDETDVTDAGGLYGFPKLKAGTYSIAISGYDPDEVEFQTTSKTVTIALGETANEPFIGTLLRTSGISGRVSVEGTGLPNVTVTLAGAAEATYTTKDDGQYAFAGLAEGTYIVSIMNPDETAYAFEEGGTSHTVVLGDAMSEIRNFDATHTRTASISGVLFIDEVMPRDKMLTAGEPTIVEALAPLVAAGILDLEMLTGLLAKAQVKLRGPDLNTEHDIAINADGTFTTGEVLMAGSYQLELPVTDEEVAAGLAAAGVMFVGESMVVAVEAGGSGTANFPFRITMQTVATGARMGGGGHFGLPVEGVKLTLYARADGTGMLDEQVTDAMGRATFNFARNEDTSPGSDDSDNIVFVKAVESGHPALVVSGNELVEIAFASTARLYAADPEKEVATLLNVAVSFDFWVKSNETARDGDEGLGGWSTAVVMVDSEDPSMTSDPLMMEDEDGEMVNATMPTDDGEDDMDDKGKSTFSYVVDPTMLPATFGVAAVLVGQPDQGEMWEQSDPLVHTHTGLDLPLGEDDDMTDLGPIYVTFTTQKLTVGVYRETDDEPGFTNYQSKVAGGDQRPTDDVSEELMVELMSENSRGRLTRHEYKAFDTDGERTVEVTNPMPFAEGLASFKNLPADEEFTVRFHAGSDRMAVVDAESARNGRDVDTYGGDLDDGMSVGAFGDMSGAGPEVRLCPMSSSSEDDMCSTFAYQWASGSISGAVTRRGAGVGDAAVNLEAITNNHSPDDNTKTSKSAATKGDYGFASVQDGEYWVRTPATADNKADSARIAVYHDEEMDDDPDDGITGTPVMATASFDLTALRLEIKGYVVNDGHEGDHETPDLDRIVRGDEAVAGIELELLTITKVSANKDTTFKSHGTTETDDDGSYSFDDVVEGDSYYVRATSTGEYVAAEASAKDGFSVKVAADEYPAAGDPNMVEGEFDLPYWDYNAGTTMHTSVPVSNEAGTVSANFVNFALLYVDGTISGRVREASGSPGNITVELIRCDTYDAEDAECSTYDRDNFPTQTRETKSNGTWEFNDLLEGWYEVYVGEAGYLAADIDDDDMIDDDGGMESPEMHTGLLKGKRDLASGNNFYVYDNGLDDDDDLDGIEVEGTTDPDEDPEDLAASANIADQGTDMATAITGVSSTPITFGSESVSVDPDIHRDATFKVTTGAGTTLESWPISSGVATVDLGWNETGSDDEGAAAKATEITVTVTAENGYDDHDYTFSASRMNPVGNDLVADDFMVEAPAETEITTAFGAQDRFTVNVAETADELTFTVTLQDIDKQELLVEIDGDEVTPSDRKRADGAHEQRYEVELDDGSNRIDLMVTSEDEVEQSYQLVVRRDARSGDKTLKALTLSAGALRPAFNAATTSYTANVANAVSSVTVTATANDADAKVAQSPANPVALAAGVAKTITVTVTAEDGTEGAYTVRVTRDAPGASTDATLSSLSLSGVTLNEVWASNTYDYTADVEHDVMSTEVTATATDEDGATVTLPNPNPVALAVGDQNVITVTVTAEDATSTETYTVTVTRDPPGASTVATLSSLSLSDVTLNEEWARNTYDYTADVEHDVMSTEVTATATDEDGATVTLPNPNPVALAVGDQNVITVTVTAEDATSTETYTVTVTRDPPGASKVTLSLVDADGASVTSVSEAGGMAGVMASVDPVSTTAFYVEVALDVGDDVATLTANPRLFFAAGEADATGDVTITAVDNDDASGNTNVMVSGMASADGVDDPDPVPLTIEDDDMAAPTVALVLEPNVIYEDASETNVSKLKATLSRAAEVDVVVTVTANDDFSSLPTTLMIAVGELESDEANITATDDEEDEGKSEEVMIEASTEAEGVKGPAAVSLTIMDNDRVANEPRGFAVKGGDRTATLTWRVPQADEHGTGTDGITGYKWSVKADIASADGPISVDDWDDVAGVRSYTLPDGTLHNGLLYAFELQATSAAGDSEAATDNGTAWPTVVLSVSPTPISEVDEGTATVTARVQNDALSDFHVTISVTEGDEDDEADVILAGTVLEFFAGAEESNGEVTITAIDDVLDEEQLTVTVSGTMSTGSTDPEDVELDGYQ